MFSRSQSAPRAGPKPGKTGFPGLSFIGSEVVISGDVATSAQLHIDGRIDGSVRCGHLCQGASGIVAGDISADEARIAGQVQGTVTARNVIIEATAQVAGDVAYETISIAAGARIDGRLARREALGGEVLIAVPTQPARVEALPSGAELFARDGSDRAAVG